MNSNQKKFVEYMCSYCGTRTTRSVLAGRPMPGECTRRPKSSGGYWPHRWVINRKF